MTQITAALDLDPVLVKSAVEVGREERRQKPEDHERECFRFHVYL